MSFSMTCRVGIASKFWQVVFWLLLQPLFIGRTLNLPHLSAWQMSNKPWVNTAFAAAASMWESHTYSCALIFSLKHYIDFLRMWSMIEMMHKELASLVVNAGQGILTSFDHTILRAVLSLLSLWQSHPNSADRPVCIRLRSIRGESFNLSRSKKRQTPALPPSFSLSCRGVNSLKVAWPAAPSRAECFLPSIVAQLFVEPF